MTWEKHVHMRDEGVWMTHMMMRRRLPLAPEARFDSSAHTSSPITESRPTTGQCTSTHVSNQSPCREADFRNHINIHAFPCLSPPRFQLTQEWDVPEVGSSRKMILGWLSSSVPMARRFLSPPDRPLTMANSPPPITVSAQRVSSHSLITCSF